MAKQNCASKQIRNEEDVKNFFQRMFDNKQAWMDCVRKNKPVKNLNKQGIKLASLDKVLG